MLKNIVTFSGGKNSTTMLLMMIEKKVRIDEIVFTDTTIEYPEMYKYIDKVEKYINRTIIRTKPKKSFDEWCYGKITRGKKKGQIRGLPMVLIPCYWMREAKVIPSLMYSKNNNLYLGISINEKERAKSRQEFNAIYPLIEWKITDRMCSAYLGVRDLSNPLYRYMKRTGCWLCPKQSKGSLRFLYNHYPKLWEKLKEYESVSSKDFGIDFSLKDKEKEFEKENALNLFNL